MNSLFLMFLEIFKSVNTDYGLVIMCVLFVMWGFQLFHRMGDR